jgi:hypothetical protein
MIRHIVLWKLTAAALAEGKEKVVEILHRSAQNMAGKIPGLLASGAGLNLSRDSPHDLVFYAEFEKIEDIPVYMSHPLHEAHKALAVSWVEARETADLELPDTAMPPEAE